MRFKRLLKYFICWCVISTIIMDLAIPAAYKERGNGIPGGEWLLPVYIFLGLLLMYKRHEISEHFKEIKNLPDYEDKL